jgi:23S rRNA-/tRNA-specific pseudouridylate synthase
VPPLNALAAAGLTESARWSLCALCTAAGLLVLTVHSSRGPTGQPPRQCGWQCVSIMRGRPQRSLHLAARQCGRPQSRLLHTNRQLNVDQPLEVLYKDEHFAVINKPSGLIVHPTNEVVDQTDFVTHRVAAMLGLPKVWPVHRLDRPTSGALALALSADASSALCAQWNDTGESLAGATLDAQLRAEWALLVAARPPKPDRYAGKPSDEVITALKAQSQRERDFLSGLNGVGRFELTGKRTHPEQLRMLPLAAGHGSGGGGTDNSGAGAAALERRRVLKQYIGCTRGCMPPEVTTNRPLTKRPGQKARQAARKAAQRQAQSDALAAAANTADATTAVTSSSPASESVRANGAPQKVVQEASTTFRRIAPLWMHEGQFRASLVECELHTGRRHQVKKRAF